jgi:hypothetical protein
MNIKWALTCINNYKDCRYPNQQIAINNLYHSHSTPAGSLLAKKRAVANFGDVGVTSKTADTESRTPSD